MDPNIKVQSHHDIDIKVFHSWILLMHISRIFPRNSLDIGCMIQVSEVWGSAGSSGTLGNKVLNQFQREENKDNKRMMVDPTFLIVS